MESGWALRTKAGVVIFFNRFDVSFIIWIDRAPESNSLLLLLLILTTARDFEVGPTQARLVLSFAAESANAPFLLPISKALSETGTFKQLTLLIGGLPIN